MSGGRGTFDGQHWREELLRKRTKEALERYPAGERRLHYNEEYKRQTLIYNQERDAKKRAKKERYEQRMRKQAEARNQEPEIRCQSAGNIRILISPFRK